MTSTSSPARPGLPASLVFGPPKSHSPGQTQGGTRQSPAQAAGSSSKSKSKQQLDAVAWRAEYERVKGSLVITGAAAPPGEWRPELEHANAALLALGSTAGGTRAALEGIGQGLAAQLQQLGALEAGVNSELAGSREEAVALERQLAALQTEHDSRREYVTELQKELAFLNGELEERQRQLEEQGDSMSSTKLIAHLNAAISELQGELVQMDVRTGVLQHLLLRTW